MAKDDMKLTIKQARRFVLLKHGLLGEHRFFGKQGVLDFIRQAGCVQFDPVDVCGKNAEIALHSRIKGFTKNMLDELLYKDRLLFDYFDKNMCIMLTEDWKYFDRARETSRRRERPSERVKEVADEIKTAVREKGAVCSRDLCMNEKVDWYWSSTALSRAALETLYFQGDLVIHHKKGTVRYYALAGDCLPRDILEAENPCKSVDEYIMWRVLRRIGAVGLLWNRASDAWLGMQDFNTAVRNRAFNILLEQGKVTELNVESIEYPLYCLSSDTKLLETAKRDTSFKERTELIAPLDCLMWDRKLINALFDFSYKWEIYTPPEQRKYGHYVLPILSGERFAGRAELVCDRKQNTLNVNNVWLEEGVKHTKQLSRKLERCFKRFAKFNECDTVKYFEK
jgi:uncharacterized protein YcaQ